jgi:TM2 domain-containing membrane protein YozV
MSAWYYVEADKVMGPLTEDEMHAGTGGGMLPPETPVWCEGMAGWTIVSETSLFARHFSPQQREWAKLKPFEILPPLPQISLPPPLPDAGPSYSSYPGPPTTPYPIVPPPTDAGYGFTVYSPPKSKIAAGLFGIFLGMFGVHRFYLGYTTVGIVQACLTVVSCFTLSPITFVWGLVEGILCLTGSMKDARGYPLAD